MSDEEQGQCLPGLKSSDVGAPVAATSETPAPILKHEFPDAEVYRLVADAQRLKEMHAELMRFRARLIVDLQHAMMRIKMDLSELSRIASVRAIEEAKTGNEDAAAKLTSAAESALEASRLEIPRRCSVCGCEATLEHMCAGAAPVSGGRF